MENVQLSPLWGDLKYAALRASSENKECVILSLAGHEVSLSSRDPGLKELTPYRVKKKKVLILFWKNPNNLVNIYAVYVTNSERLVKDVCTIFSDSVGNKRARLLKKRPRYLV